MKIPAGWSILLIVAAVWNLVIWPQFFKRVSKDARARHASGEPTRFYVVHAVLIGISVALGLAIGALGLITLL